MLEAQLAKKLLAAARAQAPSEAVPYAFEQRIMARLRGRSVEDAQTYWARSLWRAAVSCMALVVMLGAFAWLTPAPDTTEPLAQAFESTVLAPVDADGSF